MKEKILSLAQGKFRYQQPKLQLSLERLILQVEEGGESAEQLVISNDEGTKVKGFGASEDIHFDFFPVFDGKENHVTVRVKAGNRKAGEVLRQLVLRGVERLKSLFRGNKSRSEIVATFLAILELCKTNSVVLEDDNSGENPNVRLIKTDAQEES